MTLLPLLVPLSIPSPPFSKFDLGPLTIHIYALCILAGIFAGWALARRRMAARGGHPEQMETMVVLAVVAGIIGARLYHVITDPQLFFGPGRNPLDMVKIWQGGLGIWGGVVFGAAVVWWTCRRNGWSFGAMADVFAPCLLVAQAMGRLGNWFNQELFGGPTTLPWGLQIAPQFRPVGYEQYATFHPTFLYELLWNLVGVGVLLAAEKYWKLGYGRVFAGYIMWYTFGRFWIEGCRIDTANHILGMRVNQWVSILVFLGGLVLFVWIGRRHRGVEADPFPSTQPDADAAQDASTTEAATTQAEEPTDTEALPATDSEAPPATDTETLRADAVRGTRRSKDPTNL